MSEITADKYQEAPPPSSNLKAENQALAPLMSQLKPNHTPFC